MNDMNLIGNVFKLHQHFFELTGCLSCKLYRSESKKIEVITCPTWDLQQRFFTSVPVWDNKMT